MTKGHWQMPVNPLCFTEGQLDINVKSADRAGNVNPGKVFHLVDTHIEYYLPTAVTINHHRKRTGG